ncbi:glycerol-3-phosphate dehydrogenase [Alphaproteobacteria bacterium]|nr:glycerol-3-phosphate dehydrogenase [Alphaproteobacteria bacterium]
MPDLPNNSEDANKSYDIFVIGGGVNGCGIARDASGRGMSVVLAEMNDIASATSSSSTKLFHGGLRYLEHFEFRLVREALIEREILLKAMPHISWPLRFVLPYNRIMRFDMNTPLSRFLAICFPWIQGQRPAWLIRLGLFLYDHMGARKILPPTKLIDLKNDKTGDPLKNSFHLAFEYSDCWVEDSRLVILNARDAAQRGALILPRTEVVCAERHGDCWRILTKNTENGTSSTFIAKCLINAAGPWVEDIIKNKVKQPSSGELRLVRGSHIVTRKLYDHEKSYLFQGEDGRVIFTIPYETDFTLIGTTDVDHSDLSRQPFCSEEEKDYLLAFASSYFRTAVQRTDIVASFSGVRPLYNDGAINASAATRDYFLQLDDENDIPLVNIFGGKITTYRKLAESVMKALTPFFSNMSDNWTAGVPLPGGDFPVDGFGKLFSDIEEKYPFLPDGVAWRLARAYGTDTWVILGEARSLDDLGEDFGAGVYAVELNWCIKREWVFSAEDFVWRRTRRGLLLSAEQVTKINNYVELNRVSLTT